MPDNSLNNITKQIMDLAQEKGFGTKPEEVNLPEKFALIHSEVSEAFEAHRHQKLEGKDGLESELADIVIRTLHLAGILGYDIESAITRKLELNKDRDWNWDQMSETHN